jgi:hypothetical protein
MNLRIGDGDYSQKWINSIFSKTDSNSDGAISKTEFKDIIAKALSRTDGASSDPDLEMLFSKIDKDQDGSISKEEFSAFIEHQKYPPPPPLPYGFNPADGSLSERNGDISATT